MTKVTQEDFFARVPKAVIYHPDLNGNDVRVYATLSERAGRKKMAWPGVRQIATDLHMSPTTVQGCVERLEAAKVVEVERDAGRVNHYHLPAVGVTETGTPAVSESETPDQGAVSEAGTEPYQNLKHPVSETGTELDQGTRPRELDQRRSTPSRAREWAVRWCELRGQKPTRSVLRFLIPQVQDFIEAGGEPTEELLAEAVDRGIEVPGGWGFLTTAKDEPVPDFIEEHWAKQRSQL